MADVVALADHLGLESFMVTGRSGGGPYALALAHGLPARVTRVRTVAGFAPPYGSGLEWFAGMDPSNVAEFRRAFQGAGPLTAYVSRQAQDMLEQLRKDPSEYLAGFDLPGPDRSANRDLLVRRVLGESLVEALRHGIGGWVDDDLAITAYWGFDLADITVPVDVQFGLRDVIVPPAHGRWLAENIPGAVALPRPEAGHINTPDQELEMLRQLLGRG